MATTPPVDAGTTGTAAPRPDPAESLEDAPAPSSPAPPAGWARAAIQAGAAGAALSRRIGLGAGGVIGGRITLALHPHVLSRLAEGRRVALVSGTNGKTTTSHLIAAALGTAGAVAHNASGANMVDGAVTALAAAPRAPFAVLEVDELHLAQIAAEVDPAVVVLLNLTRDQLDRGSETHAVAETLRSALTQCPGTTVVANADDPKIVWAAGAATNPVWVAAGSSWSGDSTTCPACGRTLTTARVTAQGAAGTITSGWACTCGLARPVPTWRTAPGAALTPQGRVPVPLRLPGSFNTGNAVMAMAAAAGLGIAPHESARAMSGLAAVAGRYAVMRHGEHELRLLLAKNPAGFSETLHLLDPARSLLLAVNARAADGSDTSWLWDVPFERLTSRPVVASGRRCADLGLRLSYAGIEHATVTDPLAGLALLPAGEVDVVANYTAFHHLLHRLAAEDGR